MIEEIWFIWGYIEVVLYLFEVSVGVEGFVYVGDNYYFDSVIS